MLGVDCTFDIRVWVLRCVEYFELVFMSDCCVKAVMHKPSFDVSSSWPHGFDDAIHMPRTGPTRTRSEGGHPVCPRSDCPSCAEQMTDTTRWSCARRPDAPPDRRFGGTLDAVVGRNDANAAPRINQRWRESRNGRMAKEKLTWVHLTTQHVSSIIMHHVMLRSMRRTARVQGSSLQILLMILRSSSRNGAL